MVSGGSRSIVITAGQPTLIEISSMNTAIIKVMTEEHKGPLQLLVEFLPRQDGDLTCQGHITKKISDDEYIWNFKDIKDKQKLIFRPKQCFD